MRNRIKNLNIALPMVFAVLLLLTVVGVAYAATFQQGYTTGCSLGSDETFFRENWNIYNATYDMAQQAHEYEYAEGVEGGYSACRFIPEPSGGGGAGTTCSIKGCQ